jgi:hypothetical protein
VREAGFGARRGRGPWVFGSSAILGAMALWMLLALLAPSGAGLPRIELDHVDSMTLKFTVANETGEPFEYRSQFPRVPDAQAELRDEGRWTSAHVRMCGHGMDFAVLEPGAKVKG